MAIVAWIKQNKLTTLLILLVLYFAFQFFNRRTIANFTGLSTGNYAVNESAEVASGSNFGRNVAPTSDMVQKSLSILPPNAPDYAPNADVSNRLVVQESYLSLLVKDVSDTRGKIIKYATDSGGYMVNSNTNNPQDTPTATVVVRVPSKKLDEALSVFRGLGVKVVNENLVGTDVTDQYIDIDARIEQLEKTKAKLEEILERATLISDITNLTQQILSYQSQIDSYKGQQDALSKNANLAKLTLYLSTDEIALPYTPTETFRPNVIFKLAVRSLVTSLRGLATYAIWIGVYATVLVPVLLVAIIIRKWWKNRNPQ